MIHEYVLTDHICKDCAGRILKQKTPGVSPGGNPIFRCADCGIEGSSPDSKSICWCGNFLKGQERKQTYKCLPLTLADTIPGLSQLFAANGFNVKKKITEIGIVLYQDYKDLLSKNKP